MNDFYVLVAIPRPHSDVSRRLGSLIEAALESSHSPRIVVSTDPQQIRAALAAMEDEDHG